MTKSNVEVKINDTAEKVLEVACSECRRSTDHKVIASADLHGDDDMGHGASFQWSTHYQIVQCLGCRTFSFRSASSNSEEFVQVAEDKWEHTEYVELYPARNAGRSVLKDVLLLPNDVQRIYEETVKAMNNDQSVLAGIGIRALIESVCRDRGAVGNNLLAKIDALVGMGVLAPPGAEILHKIRTLGNAAAHEVKPHTSEQLALAMDVVENTLQAVYILPHHAKNTFK
jgi:hypothetical protein